MYLSADILIDAEVIQIQPHLPLKFSGVSKSLFVSLFSVHDDGCPKANRQN